VLDLDVECDFICDGSMCDCVLIVYLCMVRHGSEKVMRHRRSGEHSQLDSIPSSLPTPNADIINDIDGRGASGIDNWRFGQIRTFKAVCVFRCCLNRIGADVMFFESH